MDRCRRTRRATNGTGRTGDQSWLVLADDAGVGATLGDELRRRGHRVHAVGHRDDEPEQMGAAARSTRVRRPRRASSTAGHWTSPTTAPATRTIELGVFTILRLVKALAEQDTVTPRLYLVTANAQPAPGTDRCAVDQAAIWGLGRVIGHQEFAEYWGGLIDIDWRRRPRRDRRADLRAPSRRRNPKIRSRSAATRHSSRVCARAAA